MQPIDIDAQHYQKNASKQFALAQSVLMHHAFSGNEYVLDIGCGDGNLTREMAKKVPNGFVDAIDPSESMINLARQSVSPNVQFHLASIENFAPKQPYDLITAFCSFHWIHHQDQIIKRMASMLKIGGRLLMVTFPKTSPYLCLFETVIAQPKWQSYMERSACPHWLTAKQYTKSMATSGFQSLYTQVIREEAHYENGQAFCNYIKGWLPCLLPLTKQASVDFLQDVVSTAQKHYQSTTGELVIPFDKIEIYWKK